MSSPKGAPRVMTPAHVAIARDRSAPGNIRATVEEDKGSRDAAPTPMTTLEAMRNSAPGAIALSVDPTPRQALPKRSGTRGPIRSPHAPHGMIRAATVTVYAFTIHCSSSGVASIPRASSGNATARLVLLMLTASTLAHNPTRTGHRRSPTAGTTAATTAPRSCWGAHRSAGRGGTQPVHLVDLSAGSLSLLRDARRNRALAYGTVFNWKALQFRGSSGLKDGGSTRHRVASPVSPQSR